MSNILAIARVTPVPSTQITGMGRDYFRRVKSENGLSDCQLRVSSHLPSSQTIFSKLRILWILIRWRRSRCPHQLPPWHFWLKLFLNMVIAKNSLASNPFIFVAQQQYNWNVAAFDTSEDDTRWRPQCSRGGGYWHWRAAWAGQAGGRGKWARCEHLKPTTGHGFRVGWLSVELSQGGISCKLNLLKNLLIVIGNKRSILTIKVQCKWQKSVDHEAYDSNVCYNKASDHFCHL